VAKISGFNKSHLLASPSLNTPKTAKLFRDQIDYLNGYLKDLLKQPNLSQDTQFLTKIKGAILALAETSKQINGE